MSNMELKVSFLAGTRLRDAVQEAEEKASDLDLAYCCFPFNGFSFAVRQGADIKDMKQAIEEYHNWDKKTKESKHIIV